MNTSGFIAIVSVTFKEALRNRVLFSIFVFSLFVIALSPLISELSFDEKFRIYFDVSVTVAHLFSLVLVLFLGTTVVAKDIDTQTFTTILVRPISRITYLAGKVVGVLLVIWSLSVFWCSITLMFLGLNYTLPILWVYLWENVLFSSLVVVAVFLGLFLRPSIAIMATFTVYLVGNWIPDLKFFAAEMSNGFYLILVNALSFIFPHFYEINFRSTYFISQFDLSTFNWFAVIQLIIFTGLIAVMGNYVFKSRDLT